MIVNLYRNDATEGIVPIEYVTPDTIISNHPFKTTSISDSIKNLRYLKDNYPFNTTDTTYASNDLVGTIYPSYDTTVPEGSLFCDGTIYNADDYLYFWNNYLTNNKIATTTLATFNSQVSSYGSCGYFGIDVPNRTFRVPLINDGTFLTQALTSTEQCKPYNPGLPNITGTYQTVRNVGTYNGAISLGGVDININPSGAAYNTFAVSFAANRSSGVYGASSTVSIPHVRLMHYVIISNNTENMLDFSIPHLNDIVSDVPFSSIDVLYTVDPIDISGTGKLVINHNLDLDPSEYKIIIQGTTPNSNDRLQITNIIPNSKLYTSTSPSLQEKAGCSVICTKNTITISNIGSGYGEYNFRYEHFAFNKLRLIIRRV